MDKIGKTIRYSLLNCPKIIINIIIITISTVFCPCNVLYNFSPNKLNVHPNSDIYDSESSILNVASVLKENKT